MIDFPSDTSGDDWVCWWNPNDVYYGSQNYSYSSPLSSYPVFKRTGSIIPMNVTSDYSYYGNSKSKGYLTVVISHPKMG